ncbi:MAG TPA: FAD-dependent oxidoreductase [Bacteroidia bacterium]|nr:FAD-dependent oxidoreductase [Bacteroidia bacterium]
MKKIDFIIVGQGLAGSILALELLKQNKTVLVIDNADMSQCSRVAAGIYNPIVFKRLTQSWMADKTLPAMFEFFEWTEKLFGVKLIHQTKIARVFSSEQEEVLWKKKAVNELSEFIASEIHPAKNEYEFLKNDYGFVTEAGFVDVPNFLEHTKKLLIQSNSFLNGTFNYDDILIKENEIQYQNFVCDKLIFCEGHLATKNPFFQNLKFKPAKGEVLTIYCEELKMNSIINKDFFILPLPEAHCFKVGATYNWVDLSDVTSEEAKNTLIEKINSVIPFSYKIINQQAGVRPATIDRRPIIGMHPTHKNIGTFNGFGTKAVMLAPYFAKHFCNFMFLNRELFLDVDVKRFYA